MQKVVNYIQESASVVNLELEKILNFPEDPLLSRLYSAIKYSTLQAGKRFRPFLLMATANMLDVRRNIAIKYACVIEMIHCYSLIHDDLPALDNDDMRRGLPSCHRKFDEANAILAGDALLTMAFEIMTDPEIDAAPDAKLSAIRAISKAAGVNGLVGGQSIDLNKDGVKLDIDDILRMQRMKTGAMFSICCEIPAILSFTISKKMHHHLNMYAQSIGSVFQIVDDIADYASDKHNYHTKCSSVVDVMGLDHAKERAEMLKNQAIDALAVFDKAKSAPLVDFAKYILSYIE